MSLNAQKNDPKIHLLAAKHCETIRKLQIDEENDITERDLEFSIIILKFFSHYIKYLPECSDEVLILCEQFLVLLKKDLMNHVDINRIISICTTMMIRRKEEDVVRNTCKVLMEILKLIPSDVLQSIVKKYPSTLSQIFQKIYLVQTYYSQLCILEIFVFITQGLTEQRNTAIKNNQLMVKADEKIANALFDSLDKINLNNLIDSSRKFLKFFNNNLFRKTCILSIEARIAEMNGRKAKQPGSMLTNFNGRNLTVSFFIPQEYIIKKEGSTQKQKKKPVFFELECQSISAEKKFNKSVHFIDVSIVVSQAKTHDAKRNLVHIDDIKTIVIRLIDEESLMNKFMDVFYEKYKNNERMINDNASFLDKESIMTFETSISMFDDVKLVKDRNESKPIIKEAPQKPVEILKSPQAQQKSEKNQASNAKVSDTSMMSSTRPKRQRAQVNYNIDIYDEDNMSEHESSHLMSYRQFKSQQKNKTSIMAEEICYDEETENFYTRPVEIKTKTTAKNKKPQKAAKPKTSTDNKEKSNTRRRRTSEKQVNFKKTESPKETNSPAYLKETPSQNLERIKAFIRKPAHIADPNMLLVYSSPAEKERREAEERESARRATIEQAKRERIELENKEESTRIDRQREEQEAIRKVERDRDLLQKFHELLKREDEKEALLEKQKKRRLTIDDLVNNIAPERKKSRIEEWLESTSCSYDLLEDQQQIDPPEMNHVEEEKKTEAKKNYNYEDDESVISSGIFGIQDHQHYSSSSQEAIDTGIMKKSIVVEKNEDTKPTKIEMRVVALAEKKKPKGALPILLFDNESQDDTNKDPCQTFKERSTEMAEKLRARKKKLDDNEHQLLLKCSRTISFYGKKYLGQVQKAKGQLKRVTKIRAEYNAARAKLLADLNDLENLSDEFMREATRRDEAIELNDQYKKKELTYIRKQAVRTNEEIMQEVWREYVDNFQTRFNNSIKRAYEI